MELNGWQDLEEKIPPYVDLDHRLFGDGIVIASKQIVLPSYPDAFNPSLLKIEEGFLLTFRFRPNRESERWVSYIGIVILNEDFDPITEPQLLMTRWSDSKIPSQSEDGRVFMYRGRTFLIFNDNVEILDPTPCQRRDMYLTELFRRGKEFFLSSSMKLVSDEKYKQQWWQKNWVPFEWNKTLLLTYSIDPHEILYPNLVNGKCYPSYKTEQHFDWNWGVLRGSTPALLLDGEYLSFFHSALKMSSDGSLGIPMWHYFMGAYTFSSEPPFFIKKITPVPIIGKGFYTVSSSEKKVIFPGGHVFCDPYIYVAYGKDDKEIWIATLNKEALLRFMKEVR
jgi:predicted GH43/DUF377 family glycosyl hydrolase